MGDYVTFSNSHSLENSELTAAVLRPVYGNECTTKLLLEKIYDLVRGCALTFHSPTSMRSEWLSVITTYSLRFRVNRPDETLLHGRSGISRVCTGCLTFFA